MKYYDDSFYCVVSTIEFWNIYFHYFPLRERISELSTINKVNVY
jgi:hypothetical protein